MTRKLTEQHIAISLSLPIDILGEVDLLQFDATLGRAAYGARSKLVTKLLREWIEEQREQQLRQEEPAN